jgi:Tfp pilus assembly protein PilV
VPSRSIPLLAVLAAAMIAGCGSSGPSLSSFKSGYSTDKTQLTKLGTDLGTAITTANHKTDAQLATEFQSLSTSVSREASSLRKLQPPSGYKSELHSLTTSLDAVATDLHTISTAATAADANKAKSATTKLLADAANVKSADTALTDKLGLKKT